MLDQIQSQKQQHKILPQQIQLLNLFHLNTQELEQRIQDEINDNPLLEETVFQEEVTADKFSKDSVQDFQNWDEYGYNDIPDYKFEYGNYLPADKIPERPIEESIDYRQELKKQFRFMNYPEADNLIADFLIDSCNENGFLEQDLQTIADQISFKNKLWVEEAELERVLRSIQTLEPIGVGSSSLQEYLLIQLRSMNQNRPDVKMAIRMIEKNYAELRCCNLDKIERELHLESDEVKIILELVASLKTKPVIEASPGNANQSIIPDFIVTQDGDELEVALYRQRSSTLHINQSWIDIVQQTEQSTAADKSTKQYVRSKLASAQWFVSAIQQREANMLKTMKAIVHFQYDYFRYGDIMMLKPMILKNIADMVGLDISTISRIASNKFVETPFGCILIKNLFSEGIANTTGQIISNKVIQSMIEEVIAAEDKKNPYTDQQLVEVLLSKGYNIARRTVAKYREHLQIPIAQMRGMWA
jgi:RNA polymerase sigma-54 factor